MPASLVTLKPPLKWAGGKRWLVPHIRPLWAPYSDRRLVEPCCGGLAVTLALTPERALLNDINPHLIAFYRWLRQGLEIDLPMANDEAVYYAHRVAFNQLIAEGRTEVRQASELFYYLNRTGYNGLCRFNSRGQFNVPFGRYKTITYTRAFDAYPPILGRWEFCCLPFEQLALEPGDFVYADPPYDVQFTSYAKQGFSWSDQVRLAEWLAGHPGPVVLSNQATPRIVALYEQLGFALQFVAAPRMISCTGDRTPATEVVATRGFHDHS
jgi:DNA adenine methylase